MVLFVSEFLHGDVLNSLYNISLTIPNFIDSTISSLFRFPLSEKGTPPSTYCPPQEDNHTDNKPKFPFPVDDDDHCESPMEAYRHIEPFLRRIANKLGKEPCDLEIYDPYYCDGSVKTKLSELGFLNTRNEKTDCYKCWECNDVPTFDVVVTNPPYSGDHMEKMMKFLSSHQSMRNKPWFVLAPQFLIKKDYFEHATEGVKPFYLVPHKRYVYAPPKGFRSKKKSDTHKKSSPFVSMWFVWGGKSQLNDELVNEVVLTEVVLARSKSHLRDLRRKDKKKK